MRWNIGLVEYCAVITTVLYKIDVCPNNSLKEKVEHIGV